MNENVAMQLILLMIYMVEKNMMRRMNAEISNRNNRRGLIGEFSEIHFFLFACLNTIEMQTSLNFLFGTILVL